MWVLILIGCGFPVVWAGLCGLVFGSACGWLVMAILGDLGLWVWASVGFEFRWGTCWVYAAASCEFRFCVWGVVDYGFWVVWCRFACWSSL